jgi:hypothetical protein
MSMTGMLSISRTPLRTNPQCPMQFRMHAEKTNR